MSTYRLMQNLMCTHEYLVDAGQTSSNPLTARIIVVKGILGCDSGRKTGYLDFMCQPAICTQCRLS